MLLPLPFRPRPVLRPLSSSRSAHDLLRQRRLEARKKLEEVIAGAAAAAGDVALVVGDGREDGKLGVEVAAADRHDGGDVAAAVAVVGRGPDGDDGFLGEVELKKRY